MNVLDAIKKRSSIREYKPDAIEQSILESLVDVGRVAPSARAVEPLEFIVVTDKKMLSEISLIAPNGKFINEAAAGIVIYSADTKYFLEDGSAATENILLLAADLGLGACWIAGDKKPYDADIKKLLSVPEALKLISLISLGWPKQENSQKKRRALKDVIHWEKF